MDNFYNDGETAYIFTADHGMSDWGSHGDGHPDNTRTPLIAWGSGVAKPVTVREGIAPGHGDGFSSDWYLDHVQRHDVEQAAIAPLMAYLTGLELPVNSVGELPLPFLAASDKDKAEALLINARQILEMYRVKEIHKMSTVLRYKPYPGFADADHSIKRRVELVQQSIDAGHYIEAIEQSHSLIKLGEQGLRYLQTYDWLFLRALVTTGYLGWIAFAFTTAIDAHMLEGKVDASRTTASTIAFGSVLVGLFSFLFVQSSPITYYAYTIFAVMLWEEVFARRRALGQARDKLFDKLSGRQLLMLAVNFLAYVGILEVMVQSYYHREIYTITYLLAVPWPALYGFDFLRKNWTLCLTWALSCTAMSVFTLLPANKVENAELVLGGGLLILVVGALYIVFEKSLLVQPTSSQDGLASNRADGLSRSLMGVQVGLVALAMVVTRSSMASLSARQGLPLGTQVVGWITLVASLVVPFLHAFNPKDHYLHRLAVIFLAFGPLFIILTISYEGLFYVAISITLLSWVRLENRIHRAQTSSSTSAPSQPLKDELSNPLAPALSAAKDREEALASGDYRSLTMSDARICLFFLFLLQSAFFSTGNIASVSSFSLDAVSRLIPVFEPFSQTSLVLFKILAPFALVSANLGILTQRLRLRGGSLFAVIMGTSSNLPPLKLCSTLTVISLQESATTLPSASFGKCATRVRGWRSARVSACLSLRVHCAYSLPYWRL